MRVDLLHLLNAQRWPPWLQNTVLLSIGIPAALLAGPFTSEHTALLLQFAILILVLIPAFILASASSDRLIPYVLFIWFIGPEIRRVADWSMGAYDSVNLLSLTPVLTTSLILFSFLKQPIAMEPKAAASLKGFLAPYLYASAVGLLLNKLAGIYSILNYFAPLLILVYLAARPPSDSQKDAWLRFYVMMAVLLSAYAWFQYIFLPPWDRFWMEGARMGSIGQPEPMMFRAFSTLNSNGTFAVFLMTALIPAIVNKRWRGAFGLPGILLMVSALAITLVRASWVTLIVGIIAFFLFAAGASRWRILTTIALIAAAGVLLLPRLPGGQEMTDRMATLGNLEEDHSASVRFLLVRYAIPEIVKHPLGAGFGSIGKSAALNGGENAFAGLGSVDNGYLGVFATFGLFGGFLFFRALAVHWRMLAGKEKTNVYRALGLTAIVQLLVGFLFGGELVSLSAVNFWLLTGLTFNRTEST